MPTAQQKLVTLAQLQMQAERIKLELAKYPQTEMMNQAITDKIASENLSSLQTSDTIPTPETAKENSLYLYKNPDSQKFEIYALIGGKIERLDDDEGAGSIPQDQIATDGEVEEIPTILCVVGIFLSALVSFASREPQGWIQWVILAAVSLGQGYVIAAAAICLNQLIKQHIRAGELQAGFDGKEDNTNEQTGN